jgi:hypothetical protein
MLTLSQKESILRKAGIAVRPFPVRTLPLQQRHIDAGPRKPLVELEADRAHESAVALWTQEIERLYDTEIASHASDKIPGRDQMA